MNNHSKPIERNLNRLRHKLANNDGLIAISAIAVLVGSVAALIVILFRKLIEIIALILQNLSNHIIGNAILPPILGGAILIVAFVLLKPGITSGGIPHVLARIRGFQGRLPWVNALFHFFACALAIGSHFSVGAEGPAVHMGAAGASQLGQTLKLPNNSRMTLLACGAAAAIAASFNTPLAGVLFAIEVILLEYRLVTLIPVIIAAGVATMFHRLYTPQIFLLDTGNQINIGMSDIGAWIVLAIFCGFIAGAFVGSLEYLTEKLQAWKLPLRFGLAAIATAIVLMLAPNALALNYDTINIIAAEHPGVFIIGLTLFSKFSLTVLTLACGIPGGLIGPSIVIGAASGAFVATILSFVFPSLSAHFSIFILLGIATTLGAVIYAPMMAVVALIELTHNAQLLWPAMLSVVIAILVAREICGRRPVFIALLKLRGLDDYLAPLRRITEKISVTQAMSRSFTSCEETISRERAVEILNNPPQMLAVKIDRDNFLLVAPSELASYLEQNPNAETVSLARLAGNPLQAGRISAAASLHEAQEVMRNEQLDAILISEFGTPHALLGYLRRSDINTELLLKIQAE